MALQQHGRIIHPTKNPRRVRGRFLPLSSKDAVFRLSLLANVVFILCLLYLSLIINDREQSQYSTGKIVGFNQDWHGGHPAQDRSGACWCGAADQYCMCTPNLAIDLIITSSSGNNGNIPDYIWLVRRKDTDQLATMGGFVDVNETVEHAVMRELQEETSISLQVPPKLIGVYSDPRRDNRRRTVSAVFAVHLTGDVEPHAGDDVKEVVKIPIQDIEHHAYFSDHRTILLDYRRHLWGEAYQTSTEGDFAADIFRSTCSSSG